MVGMAALPVGKDDDAGAQAAEDGGDLEAVGEGVLDVAVGKVERFAVSDVEDAGGCVGFGFAVGCGAAGAGLARVRSRMPVRQPRACMARRVPPQVCSTSSRWAAMARMSIV